MLLSLYNLMELKQRQTYLHEQPLLSFSRQSHRRDDPIQKIINRLIATCQTIESLVLTCNKIAMDFLGQEDFEQAFELLKNAEKILCREQHGNFTSPKSSLLSLTLNNLGCYYKKKEKPNVALQYLKSALQIDMGDPKTEDMNLAGTHLNLCAVYSNLHKHADAIIHSKCAISLIQKQIAISKGGDVNNRSLRNKGKAGRQSVIKEENDEDQKVDPSEKKLNQSEKPELINIQLNAESFQDQEAQTLSQQSQQPQGSQELPDASHKDNQHNNLYLTEAIAYYNLGANYEHLNRLGDTIKAYRAALDIVSLYLGEQHTLSATIKENLKTVIQKQQAAQQSHLMRQQLRQEKATTSILRASNFNTIYKDMRGKFGQNSDKNKTVKLQSKFNNRPKKQRYQPLNDQDQSSSKYTQQWGKQLQRKDYLSSTNSSNADVNCLKKQRELSEECIGQHLGHSLPSPRLVLAQSNKRSTMLSALSQLNQVQIYQNAPLKQSINLSSNKKGSYQWPNQIQHLQTPGQPKKPQTAESTSNAMGKSRRFLNSSLPMMSDTRRNHNQEKYNNTNLNRTGFILKSSSNQGTQSTKAAQQRHRRVGSTVQSITHTSNLTNLVAPTNLVASKRSPSNLNRRLHKLSYQSKQRY